MSWRSFSGRRLQSVKRAPLSSSTPTTRLDQIDVADRFTEAAHHGGDLGVEQRLGNPPGLGIDDFDVLAAGMKDLDHALVAHQVEEGGEIDFRCERVDEILLARRGHLHETKLRPERLFAQEFSINGDVIACRECLAGGGEAGRIGDQLHHFLI